MGAGFAATTVMIADCAEINRFRAEIAFPFIKVKSLGTNLAGRFRAYLMRADLAIL